MSLAGFFETLQPMLLGRTTIAAAEARLGPCPSGSSALGFYNVLVRRNYEKILREVCPTVHLLATRAGAWPSLVQAYAAAHPPTANDPNRFADALPEFLALHDAPELPFEVPSLWAELADWHVVHVRAHHASDEPGDGFDRRLFVRQYTHPVADIVDALATDRAAAIAKPRATLVVIFRHTRTLRVRRLAPTAAGLAALARRQGLALPAELAALGAARIDAAERSLVSEGVLVSRPVIITEEDCDA